ncbi:MAG: alpha/beta fold hydrolase [Chloroflexota bacterium]
MAAFLDGELPTPSFKSLVPIQAQGEKPPLFLVHGMGGQVLFYERLIYHLGYDQPAYGLQRLKSDSLNQYSVSEIAALYVAELQSVQPTGPYLVGGYCLGGLIAFEMAQQLIEQGSDVSLLALITPGYPPGVNRPMSYYPGRLVDYVRHRIPVDIFLDASMKKTKQGIQEMSRYLQLNLKPDDAESKMQVKRAMKQNYMTHPFLGKITLFETSERTKPYWAALARDGVDYYPLPTSHQAIFREPYIQQLAENLKAALP